MRYVSLLAALAFGAVAPVGALAGDLIVANYQFQSETRISVNVYDVTYSATLLNTGLPKGAVTAKATSRSSTGDLVPGKDTLHFGPISQGGQVQSTDTFTIRVDRSSPFFFAQLDWAFDVAPTSPVANAGANQTAPVNALVTLNGSASTNPPGGGTLSYSWVFTSKPPTSGASLNNANTVSPTFTIDKAGQYVARLTVSNSLGSSSANVTITTSNTPPVANAGPGQTVAVGSTVTLNGSSSTDVDGDPLTYGWTMTSKPTTGVGSAAILSSNTGVSPTFVADKPGTYIIQLIVNDGKAPSAASTVTITTSNTKPVANAGPGQVVAIGATVNLTGAGSTDVDGNPLTYKWTLNSRPNNSNATLSSTTSVTPSFVADIAGTYVAQLVVNDGSIDSDAATVTITTSAVQPPTANAGANQTIAVNSTVTLHGGGTDPQSLPLTFKWSLLSKPANSTATLSSTTAQNPTFFADKPGDYVAQLITNNGSFDSTTPSTTTVTTTVSAPVANAGNTQNISGSGSSINLSGSASTDPQSLVLTYAWSLTTRPANSTATLTGATTVAPSFVADKIGTYVAQLIVNNGFLPSTPVTVTINVNPGPPASIVATSGGGQSANLNAAFANPLKATVKDAQGNLLSGINVTFTAQGTTANATFPGSATTASAQTDANGVATSPTLTANNSFGSYNVSAKADNLASTASFSLTNSAPGPSMSIVSGTPQSVVLRNEFPQPLVAKVVNGTGAGIAGVTVTFNIVPGSGSPTPSGNFPFGDNQAVTDSNGIATSKTLSSNGNVGQFTVTATASNNATGGPLVYNFATLSGPPCSLTYIAGSGQSGPAGGTFPVLFKVKALDCTGNPVQGAAVVFDAPNTSGNPGGTFGGSTTVQTLADGTATAPAFTANLSTGAYQAVARTNGVAATVSFSLTNEVPPANKITVVSGTPQTTSVMTAFGARLVAYVENGATHQAAPGVTVTFTAPNTAGSPGGTFAGGNTAITGADGKATSNELTANATIGDFTVTAATAGSNVTFALKNVLGGPASIAVSGNSTQSTAVTTAFGTPLKAIVKDAGGNVVPNATVTFATTVGTNGANGSFATATATTGPDGIATASVLTANTKAGTFTATATVGAVAPATFTLTNTPGPAASITATTGGGQSAKINTAFGSTLSVLVKDANDNPVPGATIVFTTPAQTGASATVAAGTTTTGANGTASSPVLTANGKVGGYNVTANYTANGGAASPASFALSNTPGDPASITISGGDAQSAVKNTAFTTQLQVTVKDSGGNLVPNASVTFAGPGSGPSATFAPATATTNAQGIASTTATANSLFNNSVSYNVTATVGALPAVTFHLTNLSGPPTKMVIVSGTPQTALVVGTAAATMKVKVTDSDDVAIPGAVVQFTAPTGVTIPTGTFTGSTAVPTDVNGFATAPTFTANGVVGGPYNITATVPSVPAIPAVNFALTHVAGPPASVTLVSGDNQNTTVHTAFTLPLNVVVKDSFGNLLNNVTVVYTANATNQSATFTNSTNTTTVSTNPQGVATSGVVTANDIAGTHTITATVAGIANPVSFSMKNDTGAPATVTPTLGTPQTALVGAAFANPLTVVVKDSYGNPINGVHVIFAAPAVAAGVATGTFTGAVTTIDVVTAGQGIANPAITAGTVAGGPYNVTATVTGLTPAAFALTNQAGPAASITVVSGSGQSTPKSTVFGLPLIAVVKDSFGNPKNATAVTFTVQPSGAGASATFANGGSKTTVANGQATLEAPTANAITGTYQVSAQVTGVATPALFTLTNQPPPPASIVVAGGTPQSAYTVGDPCSAPVTGAPRACFSPLIALVKDANNDPIVGIDVTFAAPSSGASATFQNGQTTFTTQTDGSGRATSTTLVPNAIAGIYTATASVGALASKASFSLSNLVQTSGIAIAPGAVGKDLQTAIKVTLPAAVPAGGSMMTVTSLDPSKIKVAGRPTDAGSASFTTDPQSPIPPGTTEFNVYVSGLSDTGTASFTISVAALGANGNGTGTVVLSPSGFVLNGPNGIGNPFTVPATSTTALTVVSGRLDPTTLAFVEAQPIRVNWSASVSLSVTPSANGQINSVLNFDGGDSSKSASFIAANVSSATSAVLKALVPDGFTAPANLANQLNVSIGTAGFTVPSVSVGRNRQTTLSITLQGVAPCGGIDTTTGRCHGLDVTVTPADPSKVHLANTAEGPSGAVNGNSIVLTVPFQSNRTADFFVRGVGDSGTAFINVSADGFSPAQGTVSLTPSGVIVLGAGSAGGFNTSVGATSTITVATVQIDGGVNIYQDVAGDTPADINLTITGSGTLTNNHLTIAGGTRSATTSFTATGSGNATISANVPAGSIATNLQDVVAFIKLPGMGVAGNGGVPVILGKNLQTQASLIIGAAAPAGGVPVHLVSSDPSSLLLSPDANTPGTASIDIVVPAGSFVGTYYLQSRIQAGTYQYTASSPGFSNASGSVTMRPAGIALFSNTTSGFAIQAVVGAQKTLTGYTVIADGSVNPDLTPNLTPQALSAGINVTFNPDTSDHASATVTSPVTLTGGSANVNFTFTAVAPGTGTVFIPAPSGYSTIDSRASGNFYNVTP